MALAKVATGLVRLYSKRAGGVLPSISIIRTSAIPASTST
jgi:hypothetical protein